MKNLSGSELYHLYLKDKDAAFRIIYKIMKGIINHKFESITQEQKKDILQEAVTALFGCDVTKVKNKDCFKGYCRRIAFFTASNHVKPKKKKKDNKENFLKSRQFEDKSSKEGTYITVDFIENHIFASETFELGKKTEAESRDIRINCLEDNLNKLDEICRFYLDIKFQSIKKKIKIKKIAEEMNLSYENTRRQISNCYKKIKELLNNDKRFTDIQ